jgi:hypothetical protein
MYMEHWKPQTESIHLVAGGAFAEGIEAVRNAFWRDGRTGTEAMAQGVKALLKHWGDFEAPDNTPKTLDNMIHALDSYFQHWGFETDPIQPAMLAGKPAVEFDFALPIDPSLIHPETGDPILYSGRYDMIGERGGELWAVDEKTTGYLGKSWYNQWVLRSQLTGYCWAAREYDIPVVGAIIRGIAIKKTGFDFAESIQYRPDWMIDRWHNQLIKDVRRMIEMWEADDYDYALDGACSDYGGCTFLDICSTPHPDRWLEADFVQRIWDPLTREEKPLS